VANTTAGKRVRQTFRHFNYQPGKAELCIMTGTLPGATGIISGMGLTDENNGLYWTNNEGTVQAVQKSNSGVSTITTAQSAFSVDTLDGSGDNNNPSGILLDPSKANIYWVAMEWLGVGTTLFGIFSQGRPVLCHVNTNENTNTLAYMRTPNLPMRYWIENDGNGAATSMQTICSTIGSEGGIDPSGLATWESNAGTHIDANTADVIYALLGIRLKSAQLGANIIPHHISVITETATDFEWLLIFNPTVADTFTYGDVTNTAYQTAKGATANTVTGGTVIDGGYVKSSGSGGTAGRASTHDIENQLVLGSAIDGTLDTMVLCCRPLGANADISGGMSLRTLF
jgi:hypothetical protein